jgi:hypothetical protein
MSAPVGGPTAWSRGRWWQLIAIVFVAQVAAIFWFSDYSPARGRRGKPAPVLELAGGGATEFLALEDPTLLVLPHEQGFAGLAWLRPWRPAFPAFTWAEEPQFLAPDFSHLGATFSRFVETNAFNTVQVPGRLTPDWTAPPIRLLSPLRDRSTLLITGDLARRRLMTAPELRPWPSTNTAGADLLTNTVVQMVVDRAGRPVSLSLLASSLSPDADEFALAQARVLRFAPMETATPPTNALPSAGLTWGKLVFEWQTVPATRQGTE